MDNFGNKPVDKVVYKVGDKPVDKLRIKSETTYPQLNTNLWITASLANNLSTPVNNPVNNFLTRILVLYN